MAIGAFCLTLSSLSLPRHRKHLLEKQISLLTRRTRRAAPTEMRVQQRKRRHLFPSLAIETMRRKKKREEESYGDWMMMIIMIMMTMKVVIATTLTGLFLLHVPD